MDFSSDEKLVVNSASVLFSEKAVTGDWVCRQEHSHLGWVTWGWSRVGLIVDAENGHFVLGCGLVRPLQGRILVTATSRSTPTTTVW